MLARAERTRSRAASVLWASTALITGAGAALTAVAWSDLKPADAAPAPLGLVAAIVYATLGVLIVRRVSNRIGWILLGEGLGMSIMSITSAYAIVGVLSHP